VWVGVYKKYVQIYTKFSKDIMNDIMEHGTNPFVQHILSQDNISACKEEIMLVTTQLVSFKDFGEKMNAMLREISRLNELENEKDIMIFLSKHFKKVFSAEKVNLWLVDAVVYIISKSYIYFNPNI